MNDRCWYEAEALMADSTSRRHAMLGVSEAEVEQRIKDRYPDAAAILVREETSTEMRADLHHERRARRIEAERRQAVRRPEERSGGEPR